MLLLTFGYDWQVEQVQKAVWQQQMHTWGLLAVLYAAVQDTSVVHLPDNPTLVDMKRRANLSKWLQVIFQYINSQQCTASAICFRCSATSWYTRLFHVCQGCGMTVLASAELCNIFALTSCCTTMLVCMIRLWVLQDAAKSGMQHATQHNPSSLQHVAQLLSGHQTTAAAVLAASMGDVRLASLLAQVSHCLRPL